MPKVLVLTRDIEAPTDVVWQVITDIDAAPERLRGIERIERIAAPGKPLVPGYEVGTAWRETRRMMGATGSEEMVVTRCEPERATTIEAESHGWKFVTSMYLAPTASGGTTLTYEFSGRPATPVSLLQRVALNLVDGFGLIASRKAALADLDDIQRAAEQLARPRR